MTYFSILLNFPAKKLLEYVKKPDDDSISLLYQKNLINILQKAPKNFTITTKNGIKQFNSDLLKYSSSVISVILKGNADNLNYHLHIQDERNTLEKFEQLYQGKIVIIEKNEFNVFNQIVGILHIDLHKNSIPHAQQFPINFVCDSYKAMIDFDSLIFHIKQDRLFTIKTNKKEYKCNLFGINSSIVINDFIKSNPDQKVYLFDFPDEFDEFQPICDFFNFAKITVTSHNINSIKEIAEELKITPILEEIEHFVNEYDQFSHKLDEQQESIDQINELFELLSNIKTKTVNFVAKEIIDSNWIISEENVKELVAFLIQTIDSNLTLHQYLIELLIQLEKEKSDKNKLDILVPFIAEKLLKSFDKSIQRCSFVYLLNKNGFITKENFENSLNSKIHFCSLETFRLKQYCNDTNINNNPNILGGPLFNYSFSDSDGYEDEEENVYTIKAYTPVVLWFLPEIIELKELTKPDSIQGYGRSADSFIHSYFNKIDQYKKMRDSGEPDDELTLALRHDDVDKFQSIISSGHFDVKSGIVPYNIYEEFVPNGKTNYLNYAAAYGSIKCFKYLILNHDTINKRTFKYAVYGGNFEIIKIVDQKQKQSDVYEIEDEIDFINHLRNQYLKNHKAEPLFTKKNNFYTNESGVSAFINEVVLTTNSVYSIVPSIIKHQNDLFDWIFEKISINSDLTKESFFDLIKISIVSGNAHSLIEILDKCFYDYTRKFGSKEPLYRELLEYIIKKLCKNGFYLLARTIISVFEAVLPEDKHDLLFPIITYKQPNRFSFRDTIDDPLSLYSVEKRFDKIYLISFGNLSIVKLFIQKLDQDDLENVLAYAINDNNITVIKFFFDEIIKTNILKITEKNANLFITYSLFQKTDDLFEYLMQQIKLYNPPILENMSWPISFVKNASNANNIKAVKFLTEKVLKEKPEEDFSVPFLNVAKLNSVELCKFFIDKKVNISFEYVIEYASRIGNINKEIFSIISDIMPPNLLNKFLDKFAIYATEWCNLEIVETILNIAPDIEIDIYAAIDSRDPRIISLLRKYNENPDYVNSRTPEGTPLTTAVENNDVEVVKALLTFPGIDVNLYDKYKRTPLIIAAHSCNYEIFNTILDFVGDDIQNQQWQLDIIAQKIATLIKSSKWEANSNISKIFDRFLKIKFIDKSLFENFFLEACEKNNIEIVKKLLEYDAVDVNTYYEDTGDTGLIFSLLNGNLEIAEILIKHPKTDINFMNNESMTPLVIAVFKKLTTIIELLLDNEKFDKKASLFNHAFLNSENEITKILLESKYMDINDQTYTNLYQPHEIDTNGTLLNKAVDDNNIKMINLIINHPDFDKDKSDLYKAIFDNLKKNKDVPIFELLMKLADIDVINKHKINRKGILSYMTDDKFEINNISDSNNDNDILSKLFNTPGLVFEKDDINDAFENIFTNFLDPFNRTHYFGISHLRKLVDYDRKNNNYIDLNRISFEGRSYFTSIKKETIESNIFDFLLEIGADPNIPDGYGIYPLQYEFYSDFNQYILQLINSNKIDFSKRIPDLDSSLSAFYSIDMNLAKKKTKKYTTYLHLAARNGDREILKTFLDRKLIDVNVKDDFGNTPLITACIHNKGDNVELLFKMDDLDYLHKNKEGKDALHILDPSLPENDESLMNKNNYLMKLLIYMNTSKPRSSMEDLREFMMNNVKQEKNKNRWFGSNSDKCMDLASHWKSTKSNSLINSVTTNNDKQSNDTNVPWKYTQPKNSTDLKNLTNPWEYTHSINLINPTTPWKHIRLNNSTSPNNITQLNNSNDPWKGMQSNISTSANNIMQSNISNDPWKRNQSNISTNTNNIMQSNISNDPCKSAQPNNSTITYNATQSNSSAHSNNSSDSNISENLSAQLNKSNSSKQPSRSTNDEPISSKRYKHHKSSNKNSSGKKHEDEYNDFSDDETISKSISKRTKKHAGQRQNHYALYYYPNGMIQQQMNPSFQYYPNDIVQPQWIQYPNNYQGENPQLQINQILINDHTIQTQFNQQMEQVKTIFSPSSNHKTKKKKKTF